MNHEKKIISAYCDDALGTMDGVALAQNIANGKSSAPEVVAAAIARAKAVNPTLNAIVTDTFDKAIQQAKQPLSGPFAGVPSFIKDTDDFEGTPTLWGSRAIPPVKKKNSSAFVKQFLSLGFVCLGKTALPEFGLTATTESIAFGRTRNPWNTDYSTGGSSGGSAAMVAAGVVPMAHGNDGGGSIRIPAACCGLVGLKPTRDRLKRVAGSELLPVNIVHQGVLTRTVRDTASFYAGAEKYYRNPKLPELGLVEHAGKKRLRIGLFTDTPFGTPSHPETSALAVQTGDLCAKIGHHVETMPCPFDAVMGADFTVYWGMMAWSIGTFGRVIVCPGFDKSKLEEWSVEMGRLFRKNIFKIPSIIRRLKKFANLYNDIFQKYDVILSPTLAHPPPELGYIGPEASFEEAFARIANYASFTPAQNVSGAPAITLPMGLSKNGLPIGIQFAAEWGKETILLELAYELEAARPWPLIGE
jgi:amidase